MSFSNYAALQTKITDYLDRSDMAAEVPDWITLAEANIARDLRRSTKIATLTIQAQETDLPADVAEMRSLKLQSGSPYLDKALTNCTPLTFTDASAYHGNVVGRPKFQMVLGSKLYVAPAPDQTYEAEAIYFSRLVPLSDTNTTNDVLLEAPDVYLYGTLMQAEPFLENDNRAGLWKSAYDAAIAALNIVREREEFGAAPLTARLPMVFG